METPICSFFFGLTFLLLRLQFTIAAPVELRVGFKATTSGFTSSSSFSPLLDDPSGNFSLGFLRLEKEKIILAVVHLPSLQPLWQPTGGAALYWTSKTEFLFNGSIVLSDPDTKSVWSTNTTGDRVVIMNSSNAVVESKGIIVWESFDFPSNSLVGSQNFTSDMALVSTNGVYSLKLGGDFMAMYAKFGALKNQIYWKHEALQAKARVVPESGTLYATIKPGGSFNMYQTGTSQPVDILTFNSFNSDATGFRTVRIESDGNLKGYLWDGGRWLVDYQAISDICELPSACGNYGLCHPTAGSGTCSCLDNRTELVAGQCLGEVSSNNFCSGKKFKVLTIKGVELPYKELMRTNVVAAAEECEQICLNDCSCWAALYNNATGRCDFVDYPTQTVLSSGDVGKIGYFKMGKGQGKTKTGLGVGLGILCFAVVALVGAVAYAVKNFQAKKSAKRDTPEPSELEAFPSHFKSPRSEAAAPS